MFSVHDAQSILRNHSPRVYRSKSSSKLLVTDSYQIFVSLNMWDKQGKAVMQVFQSPSGQFDIEPIQEFWEDLNIDDNSLNCFAIHPAP
jgi:putative heme degradation protein